jgi:uncharacterized repeat protein (TIGR03803 family)
MVGVQARRSVLPLAVLRQPFRVFRPILALRRVSMTKLGGWKMAGAVLLLCAATATVSPAQVFTKLVDFNGANGTLPYMSLVQGVDANFYGTTFGGGNITCDPPGGCGTIFKVTPLGVLTTIYAFCLQTNCSDGEFPEAALVLATDGNFYGTTASGGAAGYGTVFRITIEGQLTTLYTFCTLANCADGKQPTGALIQATDGNYYGTTEFGGVGVCSFGGCGTIFKITSSGVLTTLHSFEGSDGSIPVAGLVEATNGELYGTTDAGGSDECSLGCGTVFKISRGGKYTLLHKFDASTQGPEGALIQGADGNLYGTTHGVSRGDGTVFKMTPEGAMTILLRFNGTNGAGPSDGLVQANDGNFYGTTSAGGAYDGGTVFSFTPNGTLTTLYNFCYQSNCADGESP